MFFHSKGEILVESEHVNEWANEQIWGRRNDNKEIKKEGKHLWSKQRALMDERVVMIVGWARGFMKLGLNGWKMTE